ncbi:hypothetical protein H0N95_02465 [Candidatus Micrarchaeota archaeon]|nr:hypothetical protein [Candidatus Micrarchaeota archaeon]
MEKIQAKEIIEYGLSGGALLFVIQEIIIVNLFNSTFDWQIGPIALGFWPIVSMLVFISLVYFVLKKFKSANYIQGGLTAGVILFLYQAFVNLLWVRNCANEGDCSGFYYYAWLTFFAIGAIVGLALTFVIKKTAKK